MELQIRNKKILDFYIKDKKPITYIAKKFNLKRQRIYQILEENLSKEEILKQHKKIIEQRQKEIIKKTDPVKCATCGKIFRPLYNGGKHFSKEFIRDTQSTKCCSQDCLKKYRIKIKNDPDRIAEFKRKKLVSVKAWQRKKRAEKLKKKNILLKKQLKEKQKQIEDKKNRDRLTRIEQYKREFIDKKNKNVEGSVIIF